MKVHNDTSCLQHFRAYLPAEFCAGASDGKDTCFVSIYIKSYFFLFFNVCFFIIKGDSGGPLVCPKNGIFYLYGLTSYGSSKCGGNTAVYTRVTKLRQWIKKYSNI